MNLQISLKLRSFVFSSDHFTLLTKYSSSICIHCDPKRSVNWEQLFELVQTALYLQCDELINYILKVFVVPMLIDDDCSVRARLCSTYKQVAYDDNDWENDPRDEIDDFFLDIIPTEFIRKMFKKLSVDQMRLLMVAFHKNKSRFFPEFQKYIDAAEKYDIA